MGFGIVIIKAGGKATAQNHNYQMNIVLGLWKAGFIK